ncbi:uncharacterized protein LOC122655270 [Telopea speciosissima]|uniref:uncharacterized protein LOC122655270 n=1 Tax=Telopea speciosissima TaxID=54955 RepID=UPI001CC53453|nr:uncharacterized protein LOC122655270 [Telopea speciosissima]
MPMHGGCPLKRIFGQHTQMRHGPNSKRFSSKITFAWNFRDKKEVQFMNFYQGSKSILEYQQAFEELFYFAPPHMKLEEVKARKFKKGLMPNIGTSMVLHKYPTYVETVQAAKVIEDQQMENYRAIQAGKRPMTSYDSRGSTKFQKRGSYTTAPLIQSRRLDATQAPKLTSNPHYGTQTLICYNCKETRHMIKDCSYPRQTNAWPSVSSKAPQARAAIRALLPTPTNRTQGRVYSVTNEEAQADPSVITGMIFVCSQPAYVLFDSGASHSFVSPLFTKKKPIKPKQMAQNLIVSTQTDSKVELNMIYGPCLVCVCDHGLEASLIVLDMKDFDVILGMDWLSTHGASLICAERKVLFKPVGAEEFVFKGIRWEKPKKAIISALQVQKLLGEGCQCYLASVVDTEAKVKPMEEISVVKDFQDVFPEDLTRLPPDREMEFMINLAPDTAPVSKAPYRMASTELKSYRMAPTELMEFNLFLLYLD